jgi:hypothetical protein
MINNAALGIRRGIALASTTGVLAVTGLATVVATTGTAQAAGQADVSISQRISGGTKNGETVDRFTITNHGTATASRANVELLLTSPTPGFAITFTGPVFCEVMPAPPPYNYATACQVTGTLGTGASVSASADMTGKSGDRFTSLAEVGIFQPDSNFANNHNTVSSYFGIRSDLAVSGTTKVGKQAGHATAVTTVINRGPNNASSLQETVEVKHASEVKVAADTLASTCQTIPAATGYDLAASCVTSKLANRQKWVLSFNYGGARGAKITIVTKVTSLTTDPAAANNTMTKHATLK